MSDHPLIPKSNPKIVPPFIPKPKESVEAENARLKAEVERLTQNTDKLCKHGDLEIARLKAEAERLRKAGDDLEFLVCFNYEGDIKGDKHCIKILEAWNAAKEGKPSV